MSSAHSLPLLAFCSFFVFVCSRPINSNSIRTKNTVFPPVHDVKHGTGRLNYSRKNKTDTETIRRTIRRHGILFRQNTPVNVGTVDTQERTLRLSMRGGRKASCTRVCGRFVGKTLNPRGFFLRGYSCFDEVSPQNKHSPQGALPMEITVCELWTLTANLIVAYKDLNPNPT